MITTKDVNIFNRTFNQTKKLKKFYDTNDIRIVVASLAKGNRILCYGENSYVKTHPSTIQIKPNVVITRHAEVDVINRFSKLNKDITDYTIYVVSLTYAKKPNLSVCSMPCESCLQFLKESGTQRVVYHEYTTDTNRSFILKELSITSRY